MRTRNVVPFVVIAVVSLCMLYAPSRASACPGAYEIETEYWQVPTCNGYPYYCEQFQPRLLGVAKEYCDWSVECISGVCDGYGANQIITNYTRRCPLCGDEQP